MIRISTHLPKLDSTEGSAPESSPAVIHLVEGRPATLQCRAVGGFPQPRLQLLVDDRVEPATPATTVSTASTAALRDGRGRGLRVVTVTSWLWTINYRARPSDDGAQLKCLAAVPGMTAVVDTVQLDVDCKCTTCSRTARARLDLSPVTAFIINFIQQSEMSENINHRQKDRREAVSLMHTCAIIALISTSFQRCDSVICDYLCISCLI